MFHAMIVGWHVVLWRAMAALAVIWLGIAQAGAQNSDPRVQAGFVQWSFEDTSDLAGQPRRTELAVWYPTDAPERMFRAGPYSLSAAAGAPALPGRHPMVIVSHGTGGFQLNHHELAAHLARAGFVVAALTHNGDNFADRRLLGTQQYLSERPKQVTRLLDALLADPLWGSRIDAQRIGFFGHSAGGFTGLALAGAVPAPQEITRHCAANYDADAWFCARGGSKTDMQIRFEALSTPQVAATSPEFTKLADPRIKAFALAAPAAAFFSADALRAVQAPTLVIAPGHDRVLAPRFHSGFVVRNVSGAKLLAFDTAGHFFAMSKLGAPVMAYGEDVNADPPGTDRASAIARMGEALPKWFGVILDAVR